MTADIFYAHPDNERLIARLIDYLTASGASAVRDNKFVPYKAPKGLPILLHTELSPAFKSLLAGLGVFAGQKATAHFYWLLFGQFSQAQKVNILAAFEGEEELDTIKDIAAPAEFGLPPSQLFELATECNEEQIRSRLGDSHAYLWNGVGEIPIDGPASFIELMCR